MSHGYRATRHRRSPIASFFLPAAEVLHAVEAGVFHPVPGWHCEDCPFRARCWAWQ